MLINILTLIYTFQTIIIFNTIFNNDIQLLVRDVLRLDVKNLDFFVAYRGGGGWRLR
jgi:hypothetical protein